VAKRKTTLNDEVQIIFADRNITTIFTKSREEKDCFEKKGYLLQGKKSCCYGLEDYARA